MTETRSQTATVYDYDGYEVDVDVDSVKVYEGDDESASDSDALSYYVSVDVTVDGEPATVGVVVGARDADHGSVRASGAGVRPFCRAWWADASDWQELPDERAREAVLAALKDVSWRLYQRARELAED